MYANRIHLAVCYSLLSVGITMHATTAGAAPEDLLALLESRAGRIETLTATIKLTKSRDTGFLKFYRTRLMFADYLEGHENDPQAAARVRKGAQSMIRSYEKRGASPHWLRVRYTWRAPDRIRVETIYPPEMKGDWTYDELPEGHATGVYDLCVFDGQDWRTFRRQPGSKEVPGTLTIGSKVVYADIYPLLAGCGLGVYPTATLLNHPSQFGLEVSPRSLAMGAIPWDEWLQLIDRQSAREERAPLPGEQRELPVLVVETPPFRDLGVGLQQFRIWFDPELGWEIVGMEAARPYRDAPQEGWKFLPEWRVRWSDYTTVDGQPWFNSFSFQWFIDISLLPDSADPNGPAAQWPPLEQWRKETVPHQRLDVSFEDVRINQPVDESLFELEPPPGAIVYEDRKGYRYVVGDAGEQLKKTAMPYRTPPTQPPRQEPAERKRSVWLVVTINAAFLLIVGFVVWAIRKHLASRKAR